ncbi:50S ribosomal protein L14 [candidate division WOR-3 bacterium]|nr:50S ribosomal protein L14 [candidate division WOR-3 bacterium]
MLSENSTFVIADNSGGKWGTCIKILGGSRRRYARVGDKIMIVVKEAIPNATVKNKTKHNAVVVRTKQPVKRKDGTIVRFDQNAVVIIDETGTPKGTRIFGPIARELRERNYLKIVSLAPEVV